MSSGSLTSTSKTLASAFIVHLYSAVYSPGTLLTFTHKLGSDFLQGAVMVPSCPKVSMFDYKLVKLYHDLSVLYIPAV